MQLITIHTLSFSSIVASYLYLLKKGNSLPTTNTFPQFLNFLLQKNVLPMEAEDIVSVTIKAYKNARYNIGVSVIVISRLIRCVIPLE